MQYPWSIFYWTGLISFFFVSSDLILILILIFYDVYGPSFLLSIPFCFSFFAFCVLSLIFHLERLFLFLLPISCPP